MQTDKVKKLLDMLPEADRMSIISIYKDGGVANVPKNVQKLLDLYAKLPPEEQKIFNAKCGECETEESEGEMQPEKPSEDKPPMEKGPMM